MSLSKFLKASRLERDLIPPQHRCDRKSTGLVTLGVAGNRSRKSSSVGSICFPIVKTCFWNGINSYKLSQLSMSHCNSKIKIFDRETTGLCNKAKEKENVMHVKTTIS